VFRKRRPLPIGEEDAHAGPWPWRSRPPVKHVPTTRAAQQISLLAAVALIAGCGGSAAPRSGSSARPASAEPIGSTGAAVSSAPRGQSAHAQLVRFARAVNLRAQDVPGFTVEPKHAKTRPHNRAFEDGSAYRRCFGGAKEVKPLVKLASSNFQTGPALHSQQVSSSVAIAPSLATAHRELREGRKAIESAKARRCLSRLFDTLGAQGQAIHVGRGTVKVKVGNLRFVPIAVSAAAQGTDGGVGLSMKLAVRYVLSARGRTITYPTSLQLDVLDFLLGRASVNLSTIGFGASLPPELEASAFTRLVSRAVAAARTHPDVKR
jgi:hypothetical protein